MVMTFTKRSKLHSKTSVNPTEAPAMPQHPPLGLALDRVVKALAIGAGGLMFLAAIIGVVEVLIRWVFDTSLIGIVEINTVAVIWAVCGCFPYCLWTHGNIAVRVFGQVRSERFRRGLEAGAGTSLFAVFLLMAHQLWLHGQQLSQAGSASLMLRIPMGMVWLVAAALVFVAALTQAYVVLAQLRGWPQGAVPGQLPQEG